MRRVLLAAALAAAPLAAQAQGIDMTKGGPVEVTSDGGMEWHQNEQVIIAKGNAKAVRGNVTVTADQLIAHYRKKAAAAGAAPAAPARAKPAGPQAGMPDDTGDNEVYRLEAVGNVHIYTPTDNGYGEHAVYDIDQAVLVMTGNNLKIVTPQQVMTARDVMEYWSQKHMAVGRGNAMVTTNDGRRLTADVLVGYTEEPDSSTGQPHVQTVAASAPAKKAGDPVADSGGKLKRVDAFGHVVVQTQSEVIYGDQGVYVPDTGIARLDGHVHMTRGQNELNGDEAIINVRTGVSTLERKTGSRVQGLVVPNDASGQTAKPGDKAK